MSRNIAIVISKSGRIEALDFFISELNDETLDNTKRAAILYSFNNFRGDHFIPLLLKNLKENKNTDTSYYSGLALANLGSVDGYFALIDWASNVIEPDDIEKVKEYFLIGCKRSSSCKIAIEKEIIQSNRKFDNPVVKEIILEIYNKNDGLIEDGFVKLN